MRPARRTDFPLGPFATPGRAEERPEINVDGLERGFGRAAAAANEARTKTDERGGGTSEAGACSSKIRRNPDGEQEQDSGRSKMGERRPRRAQTKAPRRTDPDQNGRTHTKTQTTTDGDPGQTANRGEPRRTKDSRETHRRGQKTAGRRTDAADETPGEHRAWNNPALDPWRCRLEAH